MAAVVMTLLKILGTAALVILAVLVGILLLVLFCPIRYSFTGGIRDPEGSSEILHLDPSRDISFLGEISWLLGGIRAWAVYDGAGSLEVRALGIRVPVSRLMKRKKKGKEEEKKETEEKKKKTLDEKIEEILTRIERLAAKISDGVKVLSSRRGLRAREMVIKTLVPPLMGVLPREWGLTGTLGLGDPARSAGVYSIQGLLYPVTAGHVAVGAEYDLYRYDLQGCARGRIRIFSLLAAGIRIFANRDVRSLIRRLRRGPGPSAENTGEKSTGNRKKGNRRGSRRAA